jgi:hypothetical protein
MSVSQDTSAPVANPGCGDKRLRKTKTPGVFKRIDEDGHVVGLRRCHPRGGQAAEAQRPHL